MQKSNPVYSISSPEFRLDNKDIIFKHKYTISMASYAGQYELSLKCVEILLDILLFIILTRILPFAFFHLLIFPEYDSINWKRCPPKINVQAFKINCKLHKSKSTLCGFVNNNIHHKELTVAWFEIYTNYEDAMDGLLRNFKQAYKKCIKMKYKSTKIPDSSPLVIQSE
ncbi:hypothetical protein PHYBLDRAFT_172060 [Phycomyces blakesleeanus NRRL 1555(-)]|uniref:Uncharacterized protein n=1 Tax=Phycomyces blakesleeanus (strain ATCC 8743b / DSM 1359 / FGSC 10004 / NBRC 33097 / NRRL 1555) TaxID=763407 RepID=A0A162TV06_PHYB8|nr:hypothetical protein PHYBLDRAFT_172060 [Phycomyces blakesleeanus NRRL 1555(-)]OAD70043.1 hypothetical protein PHYBLDRAFT_172060 [Phycomyces blakesleeanus NRRL 1555(-)]|eukprot:XP_018288083.1 hypothetical protein PHYBLDRAFT_172060 [Phycomyces blakesleeanus NRRL 1555(-)]